MGISSLGGRPQINADVWALIRRMSVDNLISARKASRASASAGRTIGISDFAVRARDNARALVVEHDPATCTVVFNEKPSPKHWGVPSDLLNAFHEGTSN